MEKFCVILHKVDQTIGGTQKEFILDKELLFNSLKALNLLQLGIEKIYLFRCKFFYYILYVGYIIPFTGWNKRLKYIIEKMINEKCNEDIKISFTDHTYNTNDINSRRLRSLGGGVRRILMLIRCELGFLSTKELFSNLEYWAVIGNEKEIMSVLYAVQYSKKLEI